eukprot:COSAG02_NODE_2485_length_8709_cov_23.301394_6_plen_61_part_00
MYVYTYSCTARDDAVRLRARGTAAPPGGRGGVAWPPDARMPRGVVCLCVFVTDCDYERLG